MDRATDKATDRQTYRHMHGHTDGHTDGRTERQTDRQTDGHRQREGGGRRESKNYIVVGSTHSSCGGVEIATPAETIYPPSLRASRRGGVRVRV